MIGDTCSREVKSFPGNQFIELLGKESRVVNGEGKRASSRPRPGPEIYRARVRVVMESRASPMRIVSSRELAKTFPDERF